jgi:transcription initiation factor TFIID TATA-box-binding protein
MEVREMKHVQPTVQIQNVVASASLKHGIDIQAISEAFPDTEYNPEKFPGLIFRLKRPKTSSLLFRTGKIVCTGGKSEKEAVRAIRKIVRELGKQGIVIKGSPTIEIQNIVASADLGGNIGLLDLYVESGSGAKVMYEPEQFPGLIYRMRDPKVVLLLFSSGKAVCTGAKNEGDVYRAVEKISQRLQEDDLIAYP